ncbi:MAG: Yip1 family protein [bacterium]
MENFLENIYGSIVEPIKTFDRLKEEKPYLQALIIVIVISLLSPVFNNMLAVDKQSFGELLGFSILSVIAGLFNWLAFAGFMELFSFIFNQNGKFKEMLTLSGFALIPWILLAPVFLLKQAGTFFEGIGILLALCVFIWAIFLFFLSVAKSYGLTALRCIVFALIPLIASIIQLHWFIYFIQNFIQVIKV